MNMHDVVDDALGGALVERDEYPLHEESVATLTMKCGSPQLAVRKKLHEEIQVPFIPEEGFAVFQTKIERHFIKISPTYVQEKRAIYMKPSSNATQSKYLLLTKENFESVLRMRWKISKSMKTELKYEVFCYFIDTTSKKDKKRRSLHQQMKPFQSDQQGVLVDGLANAALVGGGSGTAAVGSSAVDPGHSFLSFGTLSQAMQSYAEVAASLVESAGARKTSIPSLRPNATGTESVVGDDRARKVARVTRPSVNGSFATTPSSSDDSEDVQFVPIPFRLNGIEVPIEIDIAALRRSLGFASPQRPQPVATPPAPSQPQSGPTTQSRR